MSESFKIPTLKQRLLSGSLWAFGGRAATAAAGLLTNALLARLLSPQELGAYFLALSVVTLGSVAGALGLNTTVVRLVAESVVLNQFRRTRRVVIAALGLGILGAFLVSSAYLLFGDFIGAELFDAPTLAAVTGLVAGWMALTTLQNLFSETFRGFQDVRSATVFGSLSTGGLLTAVLLTASLVLLFLSQEQASLRTVLLLAVGSGFTSALLASWLLRRKVTSLPSRGGESRAEVKEVLHVSWPLLVTNLTLFLLVQADIWVLGVFRGEEEVAVYGAASRLALITFLITQVLYAVLPPIIAEKYASNEREVLERLLRASATIAALFASPILLAFVLFSSDVLGVVYGSYYESGQWVLVLLSLSSFVNVATGIRGYVLMMTGGERAQLVISIAGGATNVTVCVLGAIYLGMIGVALAAMVSMIAQCVAELLVVYFRLGIRTYAFLRPVKSIRRLIASDGAQSK